MRVRIPPSAPVGARFRHLPEVRAAAAHLVRDRPGIAWRPTGAFRVSGKRRAAVAALDEHVGPTS